MRSRIPLGRIRSRRLLGSRWLRRRGGVFRTKRVVLWITRPAWMLSNLITISRRATMSVGFARRRSGAVLRARTASPRVPPTTWDSAPTIIFAKSDADFAREASLFAAKFAAAQPLLFRRLTATVFGVLLVTLFSIFFPEHLRSTSTTKSPCKKLRPSNTR